MRGRPHHPEDQVLTVRDITPISMAQKSIRVGNNGLVLWAGPELVSTHIAREIDKHKKNDNYTTLDKFLEESPLLDQEIASTSLIVVQANDSGTSSVEYHNCKTGKFGTFDVVGSGSGLFNFFDDFAVTYETPRNNASTPPEIESLLLRVGYYFTQEGFRRETIDYGYGAWFEICRAHQGRIEKIPYCIKYWKASNNFLYTNLCYTSWYDGHELFVARSFMNSDKGTPSPHITHVKSKLSDRRQAYTVAEALEKFDPPEIQIHVVGDNRVSNAIFIIYGAWDLFNISARDMKMSFHHGKDLDRYVLNALEDQPQGIISRPFSDPPRSS